jgi:acetyl esterase/lipase
LDLSTDLEAFAFVDMEHLRERGKVYVAEQLATAVEPDWATVAGTEEGDATPTPDPPTLTPILSTATTTPTARLTVTKPAATKVATKVPISPSVSGGTVTPSVSGGTVTPSPPITTPLGVVVEPTYVLRSTPEGRYPVDLYRLRYRTQDQEGQTVETRALLFVPYVETPDTFPVLVHAAGTTGIGNGCAPLDEQAKGRNWGNYYGHSLTYAAQGYIVILPNGLGFDDPDRIHPYFVTELQAHVLLDAARAAYRFAQHPLADDVLARPAEAVFFMGYSSGGHAAFAARDWAGSYASELPVKGVIGFGPTTDVETLMREDPVFSPYIVYAYRDFYGAEVVGVDDVFLPGWVPTFESDVLTKCVDDLFVHYRRSARAMYSPGFIEVLYGDRLDQIYPLFAERMSANDAGLLGGRRIPVLILQGTGDTVVTPESQRAFKDALCERGGVVTYLEYPAVPHVQIRRTGFSDALSWMQRIVQGDVPDTDCRIITDRK